MKQFVVLFIVLYCMQVAYGMKHEMSNNLKSVASYDSACCERDIAAGKIAVQYLRQGAAASAVMGGWGFFMATASRHSHWPYRAKRLPLGVFLLSNTVGHLPTFLAIDNDQKKLAVVGSWVTKRC